jgi:hypothetical protein
MYVGELLPVVVPYDEICFAFFNGPGRREAALSVHVQFRRRKITRQSDVRASVGA